MCLAGEPGERRHGLSVQVLLVDGRPSAGRRRTLRTYLLPRRRNACGENMAGVSSWSNLAGPARLSWR